MIRKFILVLSILIWTTMCGTASAADLGIITGSAKGTYFQFGLNLRELGKKFGYNIHVYNSRGSVENVYAVYKRPKTQMGIVQSDVLAFVLKVKSNKVLKQIAKKTKMVFPLYNEEIHLLGKTSVASFDDLNNMRVALGKEGSGTYLTAKLLFEVSGIKPVQTLAVGTNEALAMLKADIIDAMFYVAGFPVSLFLEHVSAGDGLHIVPIENKQITEFYPTVQIPAGTYPWQIQAVSTVAVKAVLVSFDFRQYNCEYVGEFANIVYENLDWLQQNGHPKWKSVDLDYPLKGWEQYDCVKKYRSGGNVGEPSPPMEKNPLLDAIKEIL
ncbi:TAXI family TRAP transporter solute-binding subunit [uncultured Desulfobacter sp.]|uniref:TAXI family TRAP transporter solute-binding subunit n=1 Tax=uncultured Desulfobacter sp. TaxID=240139 RepID=UPI0029F506F9|nr:TAXI family TRAP transporter solute-binding subunit [uncultured Desulfobacter sp.]